MPIAPHGEGELVDLRCAASERASLRKSAKGLAQVRLDARELTDLELLAIGGFTPLRGFMTADECKGVVNDMHLPGGIPWTIPVTLATDAKTAEGIKDGEQIALTSADGTIVALMDVESRYAPDKGDEAEKVYCTRDPAHPGVAAHEAAS